MVFGTQALKERGKLAGFAGASGRLDFRIQAGKTVRAELRGGRLQRMGDNRDGVDVAAGQVLLELNQLRFGVGKVQGERLVQEIWLSRSLAGADGLPGVAV